MDTPTQHPVGLTEFMMPSADPHGVVVPPSYKYSSLRQALRYFPSPNLNFVAPYPPHPIILTPNV